MDRYWLLTWTTYGTWLPGDDRGFVSNVDRGDGRGHRLNRPGTEPAAQMPRLWEFARGRLAAPPVLLRSIHARLLSEQLRETAGHRGWGLAALAILANHLHVVLGVPGDPEPETLLRDLKSYGSRRLNHEFVRRPSGTWWTESGSRRKLPDELAVAAAVHYVQNQHAPLLVRVSDTWR